MPEDMDIYMKKIKQRADETDNVMGKIKADKMAELDKLRIDNEMEEVRARLEENRAKIRESQKTGQALVPQQAYNFAELLFAGRPPEEIKQIIDSLDEAALDKLSYLGAAMNGQQLSAFTQTLRRPETNVKDTIELVNTIVKMNQRPPDQQGITLQGVAALMKEFREAQTHPQQQQPQQDPMQIYKVVTEMIRPFQEDARAREKEVNELRYKELESKIINPADYFKNIKAMASDMGLTGGGKTEADLKLEEMQQTERLETRKINLQEKELDHKLANEGKSIEQITDFVKTVGEGPIGRAIENLGAGAADRVRGNAPKAGNMTQVQCPSCKGIFAANPNLAVIGCPQCGAKLEKQQAPPPTPPITPEPQPEPQLQAEEPKPEQPQYPRQTIVTNIVDLNKR